ncbi:unnamed protein product [Soboliphyme baturini]|uniref:ZP domain-containing protein n=1 Tax=Soboliphyme baturini TaxID=241478 RepID=A0A183IM97_9BILA|nr:unnamed protein product [Soboliphyme baturini]
MKLRVGTVLQLLVVATRAAFVQYTVVEEEVWNGLLGEPDVICKTDQILLQFLTVRPFHGRIYVRGHAGSIPCQKDFFDSKENTNPMFVVPLDKCSTKRMRTANSTGLTFSNTVVIGFHPVFVTKPDKVYNVSCVYQEFERTLKNQMDVSTVTPETKQEIAEVPECKYSLRLGSLTGVEVEFAKVGDRIFHVWECNKGKSDLFMMQFMWYAENEFSDHYRILVKNCRVEDGQSEIFEVIDGMGCSADVSLLTDVSYVPGKALAYAECSAFKFADFSSMKFQCRLDICLTPQDSCYFTSPPVCHRTKRSITKSWVTVKNNAENQSVAVNTLTLRRALKIKDPRPKEIGKSSLIDTTLHFKSLPMKY